eukprot:16331-Eustigmatos_ZCMA.PRE.1
MEDKKGLHMPMHGFVPVGIGTYACTKIDVTCIESGQALYRALELCMCFGASVSVVCTCVCRSVGG